jgi:Family of unknown function (DUF5678)
MFESPIDPHLNDEAKRSQAIMRWLHSHREEVSQYRGEYIAFNEHGLLAHHPDFETLMASARARGERFVIDVVRTNPDAVYILPIQYLTVF